MPAAKRSKHPPQEYQNDMPISLNLFNRYDLTVHGGQRKGRRFFGNLYKSRFYWHYDHTSFLK